MIYSVRTPHEFPALYRLARDGTSPRRLATRYLGSTSAVGRDVIYFDQQERRRNAGLYSDLYALERRTGRVHRMTSEARLIDPDLASDGRRLVCVHDAPGRRDLVLIDITQGVGPAIATLISEPDTQFNTPRWSPDGRTIAVERHVLGRLSEIALVDVATRAVRIIASAANARFVTPTWRPDGRAIVAAADLNEGPFELYEIAVNTATVFEAAQTEARPLRRLTDTTGGATWPDVSADGRTIVFVGYASTGFDLFEMPYPASENADLRAQTSVLRASQLPPASRDVQPLNAAGYNPIGTLKPTSWSPVVQGDRTQLRVGVSTGGVDVLGYHAYSVSTTWLATGPSAAAPPDRAKPDWQVDYQYSRWRPTLWLSASSSTSFFAGPADARGTPAAATAHERLVEGGVLFPVQHTRMSHAALFSVARVLDDFTLPEGVVSRQRTALRAGWAFDSSHTYGYSISREGGAAVGVTAEIAPQALGSSADASAVTIDGRAYLAGLAPHHVLAIRMAGGVSTGDSIVRRTFHLGGAQPNLGTLDFGRNAISLLRGFGSDTFAGSHVAVLNVDYRVPLARPQRGYGTWPLFLHTVSAAGFADVGHAWDRHASTRDLKASVGGELSLDVIAAYVFRFTTTFGAAWGRDGSRTVPNGGAAYIRLGRAF